MRAQRPAFICDVDEAGMASLAQEVPGLLTQVCDIPKPAGSEQMVAAAQALGGLDVLVNNAGIAGPTAPVEQVD